MTVADVRKDAAPPVVSGHDAINDLDYVTNASTEGTETRLLCRDMRLRNFGTRFGDFEVWLNSNLQVTRSRFHV